MKTVEELAREAGFEPVLWDGGGTLVYEAGPLHISRFRDLVLEEAAKVCLAELVEEHSKEDEAYNAATFDCTSAIRGMKGQK